MTIPSDVTTDAGSKLYVFAEEVNSSATDYASDMVDVTSVESATINAPSPSSGRSTSDNGNNGDSDNSNSSGSNEGTYVNPLVWNYAANQAGSLCLIEHQGTLCVAAFKAATPKGYSEAFSFNLLLKDNGFFKPTSVKKTGKFVLNIPKEWQKSGRTFALIGINKNGNTRIFTDEDLSDTTFTTTLDIEGYAFSLIYTDTGVTL